MNMFARRFQHGVVDSSSERAFAELAAGRARHGDVHVALGQTAGRGRRGRSWSSAPGEGLYLSIVLLPGPPPFRPAALTVAAGLAVREALGDLGLEGARLEWPNDVHVGGAKISGILVETRGLDPERPHYVLGIGVNVAQRSFPGELLAERAVTSLALQGLARTSEEVLEALLARLATRLAALRADLGLLGADYLAALGLAERRVRVSRRGGELEGELVHLDLEHGLTILPAGRAQAERLALETIEGLAPA